MITAEPRRTSTTVRGRRARAPVELRAPTEPGLPAAPPVTNGNGSGSAICRDALKHDELLDLPPPRSRLGGPRIAHVKSLDGLRGIAVLAVVFYHFAPGIAPGGFLGVDIFFVLSGFLITSLLVSEFGASGRISLAAFWLRRARRLLPALCVVLAAVGIYALALPDRVEGQHLGSDGLAAFGYVANWHFIASSQSYVQQFIDRASPLRHTWSLAIEEQFYLIWPLLVAGLGAIMVGHSQRRGRSRRQLQRALTAICLALAGISLFVMAWVYSGGDPSRVYYGTDTHAHVLLIGAALGALTAGALAIRRRAVRTMLVALGCIAALALGVAIALVTTSSTWLYQGGYIFVAIAVALVLAAAAQPGFNPLRRLFETRALVGLGLISYGVYLWHWPIAVWITEQATGVSGVALFVLRASVTLFASIASYFLIEQPIRRGRLPRLWNVRPAVVVMAIVTAVAAVLEFPALAFPTSAATPAASPSRATTNAVAKYGAAPRCDARSDRTASISARPLRVELIGNSYAGEMGACLGAILKARGSKLDGRTYGGVPYCDSTTQRWIASREADPRTRPDAAVVFAFPFWGNPDVPLRFAGQPGTIRCFASEAERTRALHKVIDIWKRGGTYVFLVPDPPPANQSVVDTTGPQYQAIARQDPTHVGLIDAGTFIRDNSGTSQWRMPCVAADEPGCSPDGTIPVRFPVDGGLHFCSDPNWHDKPCTTRYAGGERRVSSAIASQIIAAFKG